MFGNLGVWEILLIMVVVLLVFGGDPLYVFLWMLQSGLADLLAYLRAVYL